jgi:hypothetical protein
MEVPMKLTRALLTLMTMIAMCSFAPAQWLKVPDKGTPRTKDGKPNLSAPAPRKAGGKPDRSGIWLAEPPKLRDVTTAYKEGELPIQPWALALYNERKDGAHSDEDPDANCLSQGVPKLDMTPLPFKIIQDPGLVVILYEAFDQFRQIFMDGRELPKDPNPSWLGYSIGKWEGDTLVVESIGFNGRVWLDQVGHPSTDAMHVTERFRRRDFGHLEIQATIDDPKAYTKPWTITQPLVLLPDTDLIENVCAENERDLRHLRAK